MQTNPMALACNMARGLLVEDVKASVPYAVAATLVRVATGRQTDLAEVPRALELACAWLYGDGGDGTEARYVALATPDPHRGLTLLAAMGRVRLAFGHPLLPEQAAALREAPVAPAPPKRAALPRRKPDDLVYFVRDTKTTHIKIGTTDSLVNRWRSLRATHGHHIKMLGVVGGGRALEQRLHKRFAHRRIRGEWFSASAELVAYIKAHARQPEGL